MEASLAKALEIGLAVLKKDGTSLDAVEQVIRFLEDDPLFNAGRGAVFNAAGQHELDASIMDGRTLGCGGVAAVRTVRHPISLSRLVMEQTKHVLLASDGAEKFADEMGAKIERVENSWFSTEKRRQELEKARRAPPPNKSALAASQSEEPDHNGFRLTKMAAAAFARGNGKSPARCDPHARMKTIDLAAAQKLLAAIERAIADGKKKFQSLAQPVRVEIAIAVAQRACDAAINDASRKTLCISGLRAMTYAGSCLSSSYFNGTDSEIPVAC